MQTITMALAAGTAWLISRGRANASRSRAKTPATSHKRSLQVVTDDPDVVRRLTASQPDAVVDVDDQHRGLTAADSPTAQPDATIEANPDNTRGMGPSDPPPLAAPKKPKAPKVKTAKHPTAAKLSKAPKRTAKQAATDLKDYIDGGGNKGSRNSRSPFVANAQSDMGLPADGVFGPKTRNKAATLGVAIRG